MGRGNAEHRDAEARAVVAAGMGRIAARGAGVTLATQGVRFVIQVAALAVLTRILTPGQVGLVAMVTAILNVADIVRDFGLSSAAIQSRDLSRAERSNLFWLNLAVGCACSVVAALSAPLLAILYHEPAVTSITLALAGIFIVSGANTQYRVGLSRDFKFVSLALTDITAQLIAAAASVGAALMGAGYWAIVIQQATFVVVTFVVNLLQSRWLPGLPDPQTSVRRFMRFGSHVLGTNLLGFAVNNIDNVGVGAVWGSHAVGLYSRSYQLLQVPMQQINAPLSRVVLPILSRIQDDKERYEKFFSRFQISICYTLGLGFAVLAGVSNPIVHILFGPTWSGAAPILAVLALSGVFKGIDSANYQLWVSRGLTGQLFKFYAITRPLMIAVILGGLPWGPLGVAFGQLISAAIYWAASLRYVCRLADIELQPLLSQSLRALLLVILPAGAVAHVVATMPGSPLVQLGGGVGAALLWTGTIISVVPRVRSDIKPLLQTLRKMLPRA